MGGIGNSGADIARIGKLGVDYVSAGALTHSVKAADISLDVEVEK